MTRRYCAFISYRHADNAQEGRRWGEWLHRGLERYKVPPDLVGTLNERSSILEAKYQRPCKLLPLKPPASPFCSA